MKEKKISLYTYKEIKEVSVGLAVKAIQKVRISDWWREKVLKKYLSETINRLLKAEELFEGGLPEVTHKVTLGNDFFPEEVDLVSFKSRIKWLQMKKYYNNWAMRNLSKDGKITEDKIIYDGGELDRLIRENLYKFTVEYKHPFTKLVFENLIEQKEQAPKTKEIEERMLKFGETEFRIYDKHDLSIPHKDGTVSKIKFEYNSKFSYPVKIVDYFTWLEEFFSTRAAEFIDNLKLVLKHSSYLVYSDKFIEEFLLKNEVYFTSDAEISEYDFNKKEPIEEVIKIVPAKEDTCKGECSKEETTLVDSRISFLEKGHKLVFNKISDISKNIQFVLEQVSLHKKEIKTEVIKDLTPHLILEVKKEIKNCLKEVVKSNEEINTQVKKDDSI